GRHERRAPPHRADLRRPLGGGRPHPGDDRGRRRPHAGQPPPHPPEL
ncbi:MAG: hypothetical protein AVDCRST_MAG57-2803, partial [uncultured Blastococcus sp.]